MKKKIIFGLTTFALMFFFGGIYIVTTTETTIYDLHRLSQLHRTVAIRKDLVLSIEKNQNNIILRETNLKGQESPGDNGMRETMKKCMSCHQPSSSKDTIAKLQQQIIKYHELMNDIFSSPLQSSDSDRKTKEALRLGNDMIGEIEHIIVVTSQNFEKQEREILRKIGQSKDVLFMLVTVGPFFAIGLAFILIRGLTQPVKSLLDATRRLKTGNLDHRIGVLQGEFGEVASSFNEMAASLQRQLQEMQRTEQLRVCGEMAAGLAHEIRNPLAGMKVSIEVLLGELTLEEHDREVLLKIIEQIRHIDLLMKNLLNYARPVAAQPLRHDVNKIMEKTIYFIEKHPSFTSGDPKKKIIRELDDTLPEIIGDPQQLQQVFLNLLLNAADAISEGGEITVRTHYHQKEKTVAIEIHDNGKDIPPELMEKIFQPFFTTKVKGTGLGLAVSRRIIEEHGGSIMAANTVPHGVTFSINLPVGTEDSGEMA